MGNKAEFTIVTVKANTGALRSALPPSRGLVKCLRCGRTLSLTSLGLLEQSLLKTPYKMTNVESRARRAHVMSVAIEQYLHHELPHC